MTTTTNFSALVAGDRQHRLLDVAASHRLARTAAVEAAPRRRTGRRAVVATAPTTLQPSCA